MKNDSRIEFFKGMFELLSEYSELPFISIILHIERDIMTLGLELYEIALCNAQSLYMHIYNALGDAHMMRCVNFALERLPNVKAIYGLKTSPILDWNIVDIIKNARYTSSLESIVFSISYITHYGYESMIYPKLSSLLHLGLVYDYDYIDLNRSFYNIPSSIESLSIKFARHTSSQYIHIIHGLCDLQHEKLKRLALCWRVECDPMTLVKIIKNNIKLEEIILGYSKEIPRLLYYIRKYANQIKKIIIICDMEMNTIVGDTKIQKMETRDEFFLEEFTKKNPYQLTVIDSSQVWDYCFFK
jgi:hypothetical protein